MKNSFLPAAGAAVLTRPAEHIRARLPPYITSITHRPLLRK